MLHADLQQWIEEFYRKRGWSGYGPFERIGFLMEEVGETARAVRALEIGRDRPDETEASKAEKRQELIEEMGDVLGNMLILANMYDITMEQILTAHKEKLRKRYEQTGGTQ